MKPPLDEPVSLSRGRGLAQEDPWPNLVREYLASDRGDRVHEELLEKIERLLIAEALERSKGNQTRAADLLGLTRPTLHAKIQKYGLRGWGDAPPA